MSELVGHWEFVNTDGYSAPDSVDNGNDGFITGTSVETGTVDDSLVFYPNSQDRVEIGDQAVFNFTTGEFTISALVKTSSTPVSNLGIVTKRDDILDDNSYSLTLTSTGNIDFSTTSDGKTNSSQLLSSTALNDGQWHLITVTRSLSDYNMYIDGLPDINNTSGESDIFDSYAPFTFGNFSRALVWDSSFDGYMDDIRVYNCELGARDVRQLYSDLLFDIMGPKVQYVSNEPYNVNITVVFDEAMTQDSEITNPNNYIISDGAIVTSATVSADYLDRVVLTVSGLSGAAEFDVFVVGENIKDANGNKLDVLFNHGVLLLNISTGGISGINGTIKTNNSIQKLYEDDNNWYIATAGGLDVISKAEMTSVGYVLDGYGFNAITTDEDSIYFGRSDGYEEDAYGVRRLPFVNLNGDSTDSVQDMFSTRTSPRIPSNEIADLFTVKSGDDTFLVVGTNIGTTVIKNNTTAINYGDAVDVSAAYINDRGDTLYVANNTSGRVEVYYGIDSDLSDRITPDAYYGVNTVPEISDSVINQIIVISNASIVDSGSSRIYVGTDDGLTVIHTDESVPDTSESAGISITYGVEGSGAMFEILGGDVNRVVAIGVAEQQQQLFVATVDSSLSGGVTTINLPSNTRFQFISQETETLISNNVTDIIVKNL